MSRPSRGQNAKEYQIVFSEPHRLEATLQERWTLPNTGNGLLSVFIPTMPETPYQSSSSTELSCLERPDIKSETIRESGMGKRDFLVLRLPNNTRLLQAGITLQVKYRTIWRGRDIAPGSSFRPIDLPAEEQKRYLLPTKTVDFDSPTFSHWLDDSRYRRNKEEDTLEFARRIFEGLVQGFGYGGDTKDYAARFASRTCRAGRSDCGGLSILFVAILRANGIPARPLFGRWGLSQTDDYGQYHVIAEFFVRNMGWVPVDIAGTIVHKPSLPFFGKTDRTPFLAFHQGTDLTPLNGFWHAWSQYLLLHWQGGGDFWRNHTTASTWNVVSR